MSGQCQCRAGFVPLTCLARAWHVPGTLVVPLTRYARRCVTRHRATLRTWSRKIRPESCNERLRAAQCRGVDRRSLDTCVDAPRRCAQARDKRGGEQASPATFLVHERRSWTTGNHPASPPSLPAPGSARCSVSPCAPVARRACKCPSIRAPTGTTAAGLSSHAELEVGVPHRCAVPEAGAPPVMRGRWGHYQDAPGAGRAGA